MKSIEYEYLPIKQEHLNSILRELKLCLDTLNHSMDVRACSQKEYNELLKIVGELNELIDREQ